MNKYIAFARQNRKRMLAAAVLITAAAVYGLFQIKFETNFDIFKLNNSKYQAVLDEIDSLFGTSDQLLIQVAYDEAGLTRSDVAGMREIQRFLESIDSVKFVSGPAPSEVRAPGFSVNLDGSLSPEDLKRLEDHYNDMGKLSPVSVHNNRLYGIFTVFPDHTFNNSQIVRIEDFLKNGGHEYSITGDSYMQKKILDYIKRILFFVPPAAVILIILVFRSQMGSIKATMFSIMPAAIAALWTLGIIGLIGKPVSIITVLAPIFTIVIGSADGLHFISHVQDSEEEGKSRDESIIATLRMVGVPIVITTVTSIAGFLSLLVMNTTAIRELAIFAGTGILLAGAATWYLLPLILLGDPEIRQEKPYKDGVRHNLIIRLWGLPSVIIIALLSIAAVFGTQRLQTEFSQLMIFKDRTDVYKSFEKILEVNGGSIPVYALVKTEGDPLSPEYGKLITGLENDLESSGYVSKTVSLYDAYAAMYSSLKKLDRPEYPRTRTETDIINRMFSSNSALSGSLLNRPDKAARIIIFPANLENRTLDSISAAVASFDKTQDSLEIEVTGSQYMLRELNRSMTMNQSKSILLAFGIIFILLLMSLRRILPALVSLIPIGFTTLFIFGFMGFSGISLNLFTATIFSITIGVGIDYAVHFTSVWLKHTGRGAAEKALIYTGRPIIANAFGLAVGLSSLLLSPLRIHLYISVLMWVAMISGVFLSLSLLPTILRLLEKDEPK